MLGITALVFFFCLGQSEFGGVDFASPKLFFSSQCGGFGVGVGFCGVESSRWGTGTGVGWLGMDGWNS